MSAIGRGVARRREDYSMNRPDTRCQCRCHEHWCRSEMTQEDLLCDSCRPGDCVLVFINGQPTGHVSQESVKMDILRMTGQDMFLTQANLPGTL